LDPSVHQAAEGDAGEAQAQPHGHRPIHAVSVTGLTAVVDLSLANEFSCAVRYDGSSICWGGNGYGQLGDGTTVDRLTPVEVVP